MIAKNFYSQLSKGARHELRKEDIREFLAAVHKYRSNKGFMNDIDQRIDKDVLTKIACPTLIIHSGNDNSVPLDHARLAHQMIKNSNLEILQNEWGHLFWIGNDSKESIGKTIRFIEE